MASSSRLDLANASATALALACLASGNVAGAETRAAQWGHIDGAPGFTNYRAELQRMVDRDGHHRINHFCVVVERYSDHRAQLPDLLARVYWRENGEIYTWGATNEDVSVLNMDHPPLNLSKDLVDSPNQIGASTSLETRSFARNILDHCNRAGTRITVLRSRRSGR